MRIAKQVIDACQEDVNLGLGILSRLQQQMNLAEIARQLSCELEGDANIDIRGVATLTDAREGDLSFLANSKYQHAAMRTKASAILVGHDSPPMQVALLRHENPYLAFAKAVEVFCRRKPSLPAIHSTAFIADSAVIGRDVSVGPYSYVGDRAVLGDEVRVESQCTIHEDVAIGQGTLIHSGCVLREGVVVGRNCIIQNNAVIGADGFGYAKESTAEWYKIIQAGVVVLEDNVEVGAATTIDRASLGETRIQKGTKIDNLVHIGHGCTIGAHNLLCAQVGIAGSTETGKGVVLTGQVGVVGHLRIGDGTVVTPQSGIANSVGDGRTVSGSPAIDHSNWLRSSIVFSKLPEIQKTVRTLETRVATLENLLEKLS